jgi:cell division protein FtsN
MKGGMKGGMTSQRGGFLMGLVAGLLIGLAVALGVALYITKAPIPFVNKVPQRTPEQDTAETERNRSWDPNAPLGGKAAQRPVLANAGAASGAASAGGATPGAPASAVAGMPATATVVGNAPAGAPAPAPAPARDPAAILAGGATPARSGAAPGGDPFVYFVQAGAFTRSEDAEQQRARLGLLGQSAKVTEREQAGRTVYRVRLGPYPTREEADTLQTRLQEQSVEAQIVRVEKP